MKSNFFEYLNKILRKTKDSVETPKNSTFLTNRWLSMASKPIAQIVNVTSNRWINCRNSFEDDTFTKIFINLIPKYNKRVEYIKKSSKSADEEMENLEYISNSMELSKKEIESYHKMLEELNLPSK